MKFDDKKPIFIQIADIICEKILKKELNEEDKIPSIRELAIELEVNPNTILKAYNYLQDLNIIENRRGLGYFVAKNGFENTITHLRNEFFDYDLPIFFKKMALLKIDLNDLQKKYNIFLKKYNYENQE